MTVWIVQFLYESNTFNPTEAELDVFTHGGVWLEDEPAVRAWCARTDSQTAGSVHVLEAAGHDVRPQLVAIGGTPGGRLSRSCLAELRHAIKAALHGATDNDAILLHLHGAVAAVGRDDISGHLLEMIRTELRFRGRLGLSLDLHANVTRRMLTHADVVTAYRTMPHVDLRATGERAARLLLDPRPVHRVLAKVAALIPPTATNHAAGGFAAMLAAAREAEREPGILDVSLFPVQPWLDVDELGTAVVVTCNDAVCGERVALSLANAWYLQRSEWQPKALGWEAIRSALRQKRARPWVLVDAADATTGGAEGASAEAVRELWDVRELLPGDVFLWVVDPSARAAIEGGANGALVGHQRVPVSGRVRFVGEANFRAKGAAYHGQTFSCGRAVVLQNGNLSVVLTDRGALAADPAFYECVALQPEAALAVHVKSLMGWRAGYHATAADGLVFNGTGATSLDFAALPFTGSRRELYPLNRDPHSPVSLWQST